MRIALETAKREIFTTKEIASLAGVHPNTVRFYEKIGFLTPPERKKNGYRVYTRLQLEQCALVRAAMKCELLQNGLRKKAIEVVRRCAELDFEASAAASREYRAMIASELSNAQAAASYVEAMLERVPAPQAPAMKRKEAALALNVTLETLRTWERSGLIEVSRSKNGYRVYTSSDMERLNIIRTLRLANYSLSAILRLLIALDTSAGGSVEAILNTPGEDEDIISVCDRLIISLHSASVCADELARMANSIAEGHGRLAGERSLDFSKQTLQ